MMKSGIDPEALAAMFAGATAKQGEQLRKAVFDATLKGLQGRELTLQNIRAVLKTVTQAASAGLAQNATKGLDIEARLGDAVKGMDDALLKAVDANRVALQQFVDQGVDLQDANLKKAVDGLEKMEDAFFKAVSQSAQAVAGAPSPLTGAWEQVLQKMQASGTQSGAQATQTVEQLTQQMQSALRSSRAAGLKAAQAMAQSYTAMVSGVLIGMSDALKQGSAAATKPSAEG